MKLGGGVGVKLYPQDSLTIRFNDGMSTPDRPGQTKMGDGRWEMGDGSWKLGGGVGDRINLL